MSIFCLLHQLPHHSTRRRKSVYRKKQTEEKMFLILPPHLRIVKLRHRLANAYFRDTVALTSLISGKQIHYVGEEDGECVLGSHSMVSMRRS